MPIANPMTPGEILAALLTVDGAGSGLDADLVDGLTSDDLGGGLPQVGDGTFTASGTGAVAFGYADGEDAVVSAVQAGGFAGGHAAAGGNIRAFGSGSFAFGHAAPPSFMAPPYAAGGNIVAGHAVYPLDGGVAFGRASTTSPYNAELGAALGGVAIGSVNVTDADAKIGASGPALALGYVAGYGGTGYAEIYSGGFGGGGSIAAGYVKAGDARIRATAAGAVAIGHANGEDAGFANLVASGTAAMAVGQVDAYGAAIADLLASGQGAHAHGVVWAFADPATILAAGVGSTAFGQASAQPGGTTEIRADGAGAFAGGYAYGGRVRAESLASFAFGSAVDDGSLVHANGRGAVAIGTATGTGKVRAESAGAVAFGASAGDIRVPAYSVGSMVFGVTSSDGQIRTRNGQQASLAFGRAEHDYYETGGSGDIYARGNGGLAFGSAFGVIGAAAITADDDGGLAFGTVQAYAYAGSITADGGGSLAFGSIYAYGAIAGISATGPGSMAVGYTDGDEITASAAGAVQFAPGVNAVANSLAVGTGLRLHADGAPASPRNGDIWVDGSGNVVVRSGGASVTIA